MEDISVTSSVLSSIHYDDKTYMMKIVFNSGKEYFFENVPYDIWLAFKNSGSKGSFFSKYIKGKYKVTVN
mgnify:FL=1